MSIQLLAFPNFSPFRAALSLMAFLVLWAAGCGSTDSQKEGQESIPKEVTKEAKQVLELQDWFLKNQQVLAKQYADIRAIRVQTDRQIIPLEEEKLPSGGFSPANTQFLYVSDEAGPKLIITRLDYWLPAAFKVVYGNNPEEKKESISDLTVKKNEMEAFLLMNYVGVIIKNEYFKATREMFGFVPGKFRGTLFLYQVASRKAFFKIDFEAVNSDSIQTSLNLQTEPAVHEQSSRMDLQKQILETCFQLIEKKF